MKHQRKKAHQKQRRRQPLQHPGRLGVRLNKVAVRDDKIARTAEEAGDAFGRGAKYVLFA